MGGPGARTGSSAFHKHAISLSYLESPKQGASSLDEGRPGESAPITRLRRSIADNMARSARTVARVIHFAEVDMTRAVDYRNQNRESFKREVGADLSYNALPFRFRGSMRALLEGILFYASMSVAGGALLVAIPIGLGTAVYLSEYASARVRGSLKPILEVLAGIPTVVSSLVMSLALGVLKL